MTKQELQQYRYLTEEIADLQKEAEELRLQLESPRSAIVSGLPKGISEMDSMARRIAVLIDKENHITKMLEKRWEERKKIDMEIQGKNLNPVERRVIELRYIKCLEWLAVCEGIGYEWAQTHRIHQIALKKLI